jgi:hypothetical protein
MLLTCPRWLSYCSLFQPREKLSGLQLIFRVCVCVCARVIYRWIHLGFFPGSSAAILEILSLWYPKLLLLFHGCSDIYWNIKLFIKKTETAGQWWRTPLIPALGRQGQADFWVWGQPGLLKGSKTSRATQRNPVSGKKKKSSRPLAT